MLLKSDASEQSVCMWSTDMFVREREMRGQKSSPGEHLQSALPRRPVHTLARSESNHSPFDPNSEREGGETNVKHSERKSTYRWETVPKDLKLSSFLFGYPRRIWRGQK